MDDEDSQDLFLGYTVGALRIAEQLKAQDIKVDADHPLFVYSPCGVGGSPGGTAFGLKQIYGDHVHCFFVEPTHCPAVLTGLVTGEMSKISVQDIGLDNKTEADGLAVGRPSNFATKISKQLISGIFTIEDEHLFKLFNTVKRYRKHISRTFSNCRFNNSTSTLHRNQAMQKRIGFPFAKNATHIAWATGAFFSFQPMKENYFMKEVVNRFR